MADSKISQLPAYGGDLAGNDLLTYVDVSDTSTSPTGRTERITVDEFAAYLAASGGGSVRWINVQDEGATGDGTTNDYTAIQAAITASSDGDVIYFPAGTYMVGTTLSFPGGRAYVGDHRMYSVIKMANGANLAAVAASTEWLDTSGGGSFSDNPIFVRDLGFDANKANQASGAGHGFVSMNYHSAFERCLFQNARGYGWLLTSSRQDATEVSNTMVEMRVEGCDARACDVDGFHVADVTVFTSQTATDGFFMDCHVENAGEHGIHIVPSAGWHVAGCHVYGAGKHGVFLERAFYSKVIGCYVEQWAQSASGNHYAAIALGDNQSAWTPSGQNVIAANTGWSGGSVNAGSNLYGILAVASNGATARFAITGNAFTGETHANLSKGIALICQGATAALHAVVEGNSLDGWDTPLVHTANGGTLIAEGAGVRKVNVKTASHTIGWADLGAFVPIDSSSATNWTIPPNSSVPFPVGAEIEGGQRGTGIVTVVAGSGVTLESEDNAVVSRGRYARWVATQVAVDVWWLAGALV